MEHDVYLCSWSQSCTGYLLWVKQHPRLRAEGVTYAEAEGRLIEAIQNAGGAMQAVLEFDPPLPRSAIESKYAHPELYLIWGDDCFETDTAKRVPFETEAALNERLREVDALFQAPICRNCRHASGLRSDKPLALSSLRNRYDGAFGFVGNEAGTSVQVVSEESAR